jgi:acyl carrier protein
MSALDQFIYPAVDEYNASSSAPLEKSPEQRLFGRESPLDSVALVSFIVSVEQRIEDEIGVSLTLADENAMSRSKSPFRTLGAFAEYVDERLAAAKKP